MSVRVATTSSLNLGLEREVVGPGFADLRCFAEEEEQVDGDEEDADDETKGAEETARRSPAKQLAPTNTDKTWIHHFIPIPTPERPHSNTRPRGRSNL